MRSELPGLLADLRSPDPAVRDDHAYVRLVELAPGLEEAERLRLGDELAGRFGDPEVHVRSFAALVLARLVEAGAHRAEWVEAFARWYPAEPDLRGYDAGLGWLHAAAHGADLLAAFGRHPAVEPAPLLELGARRLLAPTGQVFDAMEDDRIGCALGVVLTRAELTEHESVGWLGLVAEEFGRAEPGPMPPFASNTLRTLRVVYLLADRGVRPRGHRGAALTFRHRAAVREAVAGVLAVAAPYAG
ncbi:DUF2785 domain-containing protein [Kitasatospora sp. NPDC051853]|uniref:DUF2785 domain-containing protein n=1 Tax=Kitasatospora sp. NPDC051853 TaxID=3364058 RepID=UPI0037A9A3FE